MFENSFQSNVELTGTLLKVSLLLVLGASSLTVFRQNLKGGLRLLEHHIIRAVISTVWFSDGLEKLRG